MEINAYSYDFKETHHFYFESYEPLTLLNQLPFDEITISNLFFEIGQGEGYKSLDNKGINIRNYKDLLALMNSINDLFIYRLALISGNSSLKIYDNREINLTLTDTDILIPKLINTDLFELLKDNQNKYLVVLSNQEIKLYDTFEAYQSSEA
jgi:hypothetical protein